MRVDLRSDTFTLPSEGMRKAIANAEVGDDVYGEDPTVNRLQDMGRELSGKEACLFVSSGCMGNLLGIALQGGIGTEVLCAKESHIVCHEIGALSSLGNTQPTVVPSTPEGLIIPSSLPSFFRQKSYDMADRILVEIENTTSGLIYPLEDVDAITSMAHSAGARVHLDGARIFNAVVETGIPLSRWAEGADTVTFCLSKGLGAPMGSLLCGSAELIERAKRMRKLLGGGMRQIGFMAAAGIYALEHNIERLREDHEHARAIRDALEKTSWARIGRYGTNMVFFSTEGIDEEEVVRKFASMGIIFALDAGYCRMVTSLNVDDEMCSYVVKMIEEF